MSHIVGAVAAVARRHEDTQGVNLTLALKYHARPNICGCYPQKQKINVQVCFQDPPGQ